MKLFSVFSGKKKAVSLSQTTRRSLYISIAVHACLLAAAGGWVISNVFLNNTPTFVGQPPPMKSYEPKQLEHKVKVQKRQRASSRPSVIPRIVSMRAADIVLPEIKMDPKVIHTSFQPKFKAMSGSGMGVGVGNGYGTGGFGTGVSKFDFFGISGKGEKIMICVDVSISMIEDREGGIKGYEKVKARVNQVIDALSEGTLFNVVAFADAAQTFKEKLVISNGENKKEAKVFVKYYNATIEGAGLTTGNVAPAEKGLQATGGTTRLDLALTAAFQQGSDTILIISDGVPMVGKGFSASQQQAYSNMAQNWNKEHATEVQKWQDQNGDSGDGGGGEKVLIPAQPARPPSNKPLKEGEPRDMGSPAIPEHWEYARTTRRGGSRPAPPPPPKPEYWTLPDFLTHLKLLHEEYYLAKGTKRPTIHCIGYMIDKPGDVFLRALSKEYKGKYKYVKKL